MGVHEDIARLRSLAGIKWSYHEDDVVPTWVADMDLPTAPVVEGAIRELVDRGDLGYNFAAHERIPEAWAEWSERRHAWRPDTEHVRLFSNVLQPIAAALHVATDPGDGVVLNTPVYPLFFGLIEGGGRRIDECPLDPDGWRLDADLLRTVVDERTGAFLLCNPHNPSGRVLDEEELGAVAAVAEEHDLLVISDEIWQDLVFPGITHVPFASLSDDAAGRTITITAASKTFNLGGLNCAVAHVGSDDLLERLDALPPHLLGGVSSPGAAATLAAWTGGEPWLAETLELLRRNRDHLAERLATELPGVGFDVPEATYLAWLDFREFQLGPDPATQLLEDGRVALSSGPDFGAPGEGFARLNFATHREILDEILDRIAAAVG
jgi:cystathionine beta-lyase